MCFSEENKTAIELFKHYGNIRFVMLPMFFTTLGAVIVAYWKVSTSEHPDESLLLWIAIAGALISTLFTIYEYRLSSTLVNVSALLPDAISSLKHENVVGLVTFITLVVYACPIAFWLWRAVVHF